jgi:hypothetical protein
MGPTLRRLCGVDPTTRHSDARRALLTMLDDASKALPPELQLATSVMFAIDEDHRHRFLRQRYESLAQRWNCDFRTVQRRCDEAVDLLSEQIDRRADVPHRRGESAKVFEADAWYLHHVRVVLLLNRKRPQAFEERTLVSTMDGLSKLGVAVGLPRHPDEERSQLAVETEVLYGAELESTQSLSETMFVQYLRLPRPLTHGERHTYARRIGIPDGQLMAPRYVHIPVHRCDQFDLRVKFPPAALPPAVWLLDRVPEMVFTNGRPGPRRIQPDPLGEVHARFTDLQLGFGYGVAWLPGKEDNGGPPIPCR